MCDIETSHLCLNHKCLSMDRRGRDRMVVGFMTTYAIWNKVCQWLATGRWCSPGPPVSSTNSWNIVESGVKYHQANTLLTRDTWMYSHRWFTCFKLELFHREAGLKLLCWFKLLDQLVLIWGNSFHLISLS